MALRKRARSKSTSEVGVISHTLAEPLVRDQVAETSRIPIRTRVCRPTGQLKRDRAMLEPTTALAAAPAPSRGAARPYPANPRLRSWRSWTRCGSTSGCGRRVLQDAQRGDGGRPRRAGTRQRRAREAVEGRRRWGCSRGDDRDGAPTVAVTAVAERRGPASAAATMYAETPESRAAREQHGLERRLARPLGADLGARPPSRRAVGLTSSAAHSGAGAELSRRPVLPLQVGVEIGQRLGLSEGTARQICDSSS